MKPSQKISGNYFTNPSDKYVRIEMFLALLQYLDEEYEKNVPKELIEGVQKDGKKLGINPNAL